jgi:hypothetical protein
MNSPSGRRNRSSTGRKPDASVFPRTGVRLRATKERVKKTRRLIAQSKDLLRHARQALDSSTLLRVALERASQSDSEQ